MEESGLAPGAQQVASLKTSICPQRINDISCCNAVVVLKIKCKSTGKHLSARIIQTLGVGHANWQKLLGRTNPTNTCKYIRWIPTNAVLHQKEKDQTAFKPIRIISPHLQRIREGKFKSSKQQTRRMQRCRKLLHQSGWSAGCGSRRGASHGGADRCGSGFGQPVSQHMTRVGEFVELLPGAHPKAKNLRHGPNKECWSPAKGSNVEQRGATWSNVEQPVNQMEVT